MAFKFKNHENNKSKTQSRQNEFFIHKNIFSKMPFKMNNFLRFFFEFFITNPKKFKR